jgi:sugar phosphate isomerase/epimerase
MIYVSTGGKSSQTAYETACEFLKFDIKNIELSGGIYDKKADDNIKLLANHSNIQLHNYFPPPAKPFVMNLASNNVNIVETTKNHIKRALNLSAEIGTFLYSFHAGFLLDPKVEELGNRVEKKPLINRDKAMSRFIENVNELALFAEELGATLLIENNVLSYSNYHYFNENPFLMVNAEECIKVMNETPDNVLLLVDVAHLKVSSNSLGFNKIQFLELVNSFIGAYHLSDNDGLSDSNEEVRKDSWFWPYINTDKNYYSLEVYRKNPQFLLNQVSLAKRMLNLN